MQADNKLFLLGMKIKSDKVAKFDKRAIAIHFLVDYLKNQIG